MPVDKRQVAIETQSARNAVFSTLPEAVLLSMLHDEEEEAKRAERVIKNLIYTTWKLTKEVEEHIIKEQSK